MRPRFASRSPLIPFLLVSALGHSPFLHADSGPSIQSLLPEAQLARGAKTFARTCAACHGRRGQGDGSAAADLSPAPRDFTQGQYRFRTTPTGALPRPEDLEATIRAGLPGTAMPAFGDLLSPAELRDLVSFLYSLLPPNRLEDPFPDAVPAPPAAAAAADGGTIAQGRGLYLLLECWSCHGLDGTGRGRASATLQDETGRPIPPPDFRFSPLKRGREPEAIVRTLVTGLNGTPMPSYDDAVRLAREDVANVALFRERLPEASYAELTAFVRTVPTRAEVAALDDAGQQALHDRWLRALADYVVSLDERRGFRFWLFHERPESEARK